jgi:hypothetical protein
MKIIVITGLLLLVGWPTSAKDVQICQRLLAGYEKDLKLSLTSLDQVSTNTAGNLTPSELEPKLAAGEHAILFYSMASTALAYAQGYHCNLGPFLRAEGAFRAKYER